MTDYTDFLAGAGWASAEVRPLAGDASNRRYLRVSRNGHRAVLMDAAPERGEDTGPFLKIAAHLRAVGLHAPAVFSSDPVAGLILLEDLGDGLFARRFEIEPDSQNRLYKSAIDVLLRLHAGPLPPGDVPDYTACPMAEAAKLAGIWYADDLPSAEALATSMTTALTALDWSQPVLVLRDYHAENLLWIDNADGLDRVGLLDFQDAARGHPVYDVISLMQDARRDVPADVAHAMAMHYQTGSGMTGAVFDHAAAVLGAQRALRILGVFARLSLHFNKPDYVDLIPRVWGQLQANLHHPSLRDLAELTSECLPKPSAEHLASLKARAGTCPRL
ncbi:MAG: phosphotransferase [Dinoroseobacter sp.]|nr:phosphotransferase [Dinoroseobacter sp.]